MLDLVLVRLRVAGGDDGLTSVPSVSPPSVPTPFPPGWRCSTAPKGSCSSGQRGRGEGRILCVPPPSPARCSPLPAQLVEGAGQCHHLGGGPADDGDAEHGGDLAAQHAAQLLVLLLREGGEMGQDFTSNPPGKPRATLGTRGTPCPRAQGAGGHARRVPEPGQGPTSLMSFKVMDFLSSTTCPRRPKVSCGWRGWVSPWDPPPPLPGTPYPPPHPSPPPDPAHRKADLLLQDPVPHHLEEMGRRGVSCHGMVADPHGAVPGGVQWDPLTPMGPTDPMEGGSGWGDRPGGTHLAEELVVILGDEQEAAAERLGLLLQLGGQRVGVSTPACPKPPPGRSRPLLCLPVPRVPVRATQSQVPP